MTTFVTRVHWGNGFAAIHAGLTVLMGDDSVDLRDDIWVAVRSGGIERVLDALMADGSPRSTSFVVAHQEDDGLRLFLRGDGVVRVTAEQGDEEFNAASMRTWSERLISSWTEFTAVIEQGVDHTAPASWIESGVVSASSCTQTNLGMSSDCPETSPASVGQLSEPTTARLTKTNAPIPNQTMAVGLADGLDSKSASASSEPADTPSPVDEGSTDDVSGSEVAAVEELGDSVVPHNDFTDGVPDSDERDPHDPPDEPADSGLSDDRPGDDEDFGGRPEHGSDSGYSEMFGATRHRSVAGAAITDPEAPAAEMISAVPKALPPVDDANRSESTWSSRNFDDGSESATGTPESAPSAPDPNSDGDHDGHTLSIDEVRRLRGTPSGPVAAPPATSESGAAVVQALICPEGHPNPPYDSVCRMCGVALDATPCVIDRPPLGRLRFSTGDDVVLDRPLLVGRKPDPKGRRFSDIPRLLQLDVGDGLSRSHALVHLEGWQVRIEDLGSTNDTTVTLPGRQPQRLRAGQPVLIVDGTSIDLGGEVECVFDAYI